MNTQERMEMQERMERLIELVVRTLNVLTNKITALDDKQSRILYYLKQIKMAETTNQELLDVLLTDVEDENSVIDASLNLLDNLSSELGKALSGPTLDASKIKQIKDLIDSKKEAIKASILKNTPATPVASPVTDPASTGGSALDPSANTGTGNTPSTDTGETPPPDSQP